MNIGNRIKQLAENANISISQLAKLSGISQPVMSRLVNNNNRIPDVPTLEKICSALNITLSEFFNEGSEPIVLTPELKELLEQSKELTPEQLAKLTEFIKAIK